MIMQMNTIENNKNCVVYITHILNVDIVKYLLYLKEEILTTLQGAF